MSRRDAIALLYVDDDPNMRSLTADMLTGSNERFEVTTASTAAEGLDWVRDHTVDCIISDYQMPKMDGLAFLRAIREEYHDVPFILFTGAGDEAIASEAITAGVTEYVRKGTGIDQYTILAHRITNAVDQYRTQRRATHSYRAMETAAEGLSLIKPDGTFTYVNAAYADLFGYEQSALDGTHWRVLYPGDRAERLERDILPAVLETGYWAGETVRQTTTGKRLITAHRLARTEDGVIVCTGRDLTSDRLTPVSGDSMAIHDGSTEFPVICTMDHEGYVTRWTEQARQITGYEAQEAICQHFALLLTADQNNADALLETASTEETVTTDGAFAHADGPSISATLTITPIYTKESQPLAGFRLTATTEGTPPAVDDLTSIVSHDLRSPLNVARTRLELAQQDCDSEHLEAVADAQDRMDELIKDLLVLARDNTQQLTIEPINLTMAAREAWQSIVTPEATLTVTTDRTIHADHQRFRQLLENLFRNAIDHAGPSVSVTVDTFEDGFFIADDGPGIPDRDRITVFESGYTTDEDGTGLGLSIVKQIADAHDWQVSLTESANGGVRVICTGVTFADD